MVTLILGYAAYRFKRFNQLHYGTVEVIFGTIAGGVATAYVGVANFYATLATFVGSIYVVSRGCSNIAEGYTKQQQRKREREAL